MRPILDHPNVTLLVDAEVLKLETDASGRTVTGVSCLARWRIRDLHRRHRRRVGRSGEHRQAAAGLGERASPERSGQRVRPGRSQLHVPQQQSGGRAVEESPTTRSSRRRSASTTSTSARTTTSIPMGNIQMVGKSNAEAMKGEEPAPHQARPPLDAGRRRPAMPSTSGSPPRICRSPTTGSRWRTTATSGWRTR